MHPAYVYRGFSSIASGLLLTMGLSACVSGQSPDPQSGVAMSKRLVVTSSALQAGAVGLPKRYACKEGKIWLPLEWSDVPKATAEVVLVIGINEIVRKENANTFSLVNEVFVGGLAPGRHDLLPGEIPKNAFITSHRAGADCPPLAVEAGLVFTIYAMPPGHRLHSFEHVGLATVKDLEKWAIALGSLPALYGSSGGSS